MKSGIFLLEFRRLIQLEGQRYTGFVNEVFGAKAVNWLVVWNIFYFPIY